MLEKKHRSFLWRGKLFYKRGILKKETIIQEKQENSIEEGPIHCSTTHTLKRNAVERSVN